MSSTEENQAPQESPAGSEPVVAAPAAPAPVAPAEAAPAQVAETAPVAPAAPAFGTGRGSGLSRGKRKHKAAPAAESAAPAYRPTVIAVIPLPRDTSGFGSDAAEEETTPVETAPAATPAAPEATVAPVESAPVSKPVVEASEAPAEVKTESSEPAEKPQLDILPPAPRQQSEHRWERPSDRREGGERPFRGERREGERREGRRFEGERREGSRRPEREDGPERELRTERPEQPAVAKTTEKKSGGLFGWVKSLFGGKTEETPAEADKRQPREGGEGDARRRRRGGRGRNRGQGGGSGEYRGERGPREGGERREGGFGGGERRRRGGRGRGHGRGGERGPRSESSQG